MPNEYANNHIVYGASARRPTYADMRSKSFRPVLSPTRTGMGLSGYSVWSRNRANMGMYGPIGMPDYMGEGEPEQKQPTVTKDDVIAALVRYYNDPVNQAGGTPLSNIAKNIGWALVTTGITGPANIATAIHDWFRSWTTSPESWAVGIYDAATNYEGNTIQNNQVVATILENAKKYATSAYVVSAMDGMKKEICNYTGTDPSKITDTTYSGSGSGGSEPLSWSYVLGWLAMAYGTYKLIQFGRDRYYGFRTGRLARKEAALEEKRRKAQDVITETSKKKDVLRKKREELEEEGAKGIIFKDWTRIPKKDKESRAAKEKLDEIASSIEEQRRAAKEAQIRAIRRTEQLVDLPSASGGAPTKEAKDVYKEIATEEIRGLKDQYPGTRHLIVPELGGRVLEMRRRLQSGEKI